MLPCTIRGVVQKLRGADQSEQLRNRVSNPRGDLPLNPTSWLFLVPSQPVGARKPFPGLQGPRAVFRGNEFSGGRRVEPAKRRRRSGGRGHHRLPSPHTATRPSPKRIQRFRRNGLSSALPLEAKNSLIISAAVSHARGQTVTSCRTRVASRCAWHVNAERDSRQGPSPSVRSSAILVLDGRPCFMWGLMMMRLYVRWELAWTHSSGGSMRSSPRSSALNSVTLTERCVISVTGEHGPVHDFSNGFSRLPHATRG